MDNSNVNQLIENAQKSFLHKKVSIISQNCIGGVFYHDMNEKFLSPTINLYFDAYDFLKFVKNISYYLSLDIKIIQTESIIIGKLDDIKIYFLHYHDVNEAINKWNNRKERVITDKLFIICTDRDGFDNECFEIFKSLPYHKALLTCNSKWKDYPFCIYLDKYKNEEFVPDTIPLREFYNNGRLVDLINEV